MFVVRCGYSISTVSTFVLYNLICITYSSSNKSLLTLESKLASFLKLFFLHILLMLQGCICMYVNHTVSQIKKKMNINWRDSVRCSARCALIRNVCLHNYFVIACTYKMFDESILNAANHRFSGHASFNCFLGHNHHCMYMFKEFVQFRDCAICLHNLKITRVQFANVMGGTRLRCHS